MRIEHENLGTVVGRSNHSPKRDLQLVFPKLIHKLHYHLSMPRTKKSTDRGAGRRLAQLNLGHRKARLGRKERLSCAFFVCAPRVVLVFVTV